jgi:hypothetical protein
MAMVPGALTVADWIRQLMARGAVSAPDAGTASAPEPAPPPEEAGTGATTSIPPQVRRPAPYANPSNNTERLLNDLDGYTQDRDYWRGIANDPKYSSATRDEAQKKVDAAADDINKVNNQVATEQARTQHPAKGSPIETIETYGGRQYRVHWTADGVGGKTLDATKGTAGVEPMDLGAGERITANGQVYTLSADGKTATPLAGVGPAVQVEQRNGRTYFSTDQGRTWQPTSGLPATQTRIQGQDGQWYTLSEDGTSATPIGGVGRAVQVQQRGGNSYISKDGGATWEPAQGLPSVPTTQTVDGRVVGIDPLTGRQVFSTDVLTPEGRARQEELDRLKLEEARRGTLPANAYAALQQETTRLQGRAQQELDRLKGLQEQGALSAEQASSQFGSWFQTNVTGPLAGLRATAEEAQRQERQQVEERNRLEDIRVQQANAQREQLAQQYGERARDQLISTFPSARSPEFARAYGANVAAMANRAGGRTAEERMAAPRGPGYTGAAFAPQHIVAVMPSPDQIAAAARERALAAIAPAQAMRSGYAAPALPGMPDMEALLARVPYTGVVPQAPAGVLPTPGREAVDLGTGYARTYLGPTGSTWLPDWRIPG